MDQLVLVVIAVGALVGMIATLVIGRRSRRAAPSSTDSVTIPQPAAATSTLAERATTLEAPEAADRRLARLRGRLAGAPSGFGRAVRGVLRRDQLDDQAWDDLEDALITADLGVETSASIVAAIRTKARATSSPDPAALQQLLRDELLRLLDPDADRALQLSATDGVPAVVMVVGVNGTGKTTTTGKLARLLVADDHDVLLAAADTFRAAAVDQLQTWGDNVGVAVVRGDEGADPASVAFDAAKAAVDGGCDVLLVDTAGRLHTKTGLMDELGKVKRVIEKVVPVTEVLLVIDATTGQNGLLQAKVFAEVVRVTGLVLTKLDGSAKGGIVVSVQRELGVPVKFVGLGEGPDDLAPFDASMFVDALLSEDRAG